MSSAAREALDQDSPLPPFANRQRGCRVVVQWAGGFVPITVPPGVVELRGDVLDLESLFPVALRGSLFFAYRYGHIGMAFIINRTRPQTCRVSCVVCEAEADYVFEPTRIRPGLPA